MMSRKMDSKRFENLEYDVVINKRGGKFVLFIPELAIIEEDESLEEAYQKVKLEKEKYVQKMVEFDLQNEIVEPQKEITGKGIFAATKADIAAFIIKIMIIIVVGVIAMLFISSRVESIKSADFGRVIYKRVSSLCDRINDMPDERIESAKLKLGKTVKKVEPLVDEVKVLLQDDSDVASGKSLKR